MHGQVGWIDDDGPGALQSRYALVQEGIERRAFGEEAAGAAQPRAAQPIGVEEARIVALESVADGAARRIGGVGADHRAEQYWRVAHAAGERSRGILAMRYRHDAAAAHQSKRRLQADNDIER